ncbi:MAG: amidohydrolase [Deltaproteobacteria bacterium]|nr:amidohydrolase [Deltaproteobacteria bacterium]
MRTGRRMGHGGMLIALMGLLVLAGGAAGAAVDLGPDLVLFNGKIVTMDGRSSVVEALAVKDGRFVTVGSAREVLVLATPRTQRVDLRGRAVIPGLYDTHNHMLSTGIARRRVDLSRARSIQDVLDAVAARVRASRPGEWIVASGGWHEGLLRERRFPTREEIDRVAPNNPVYIPRGGHNAVVNSLAFKLAGITKDTASPGGGGVFVKDVRTGELTGHVIGEPAFSRILRLIPPLPQPELVEILREVTALYNAAGITSVIDPGLRTPHELRAYQAAWQQGKLTVRVNAMIRIEPRAISAEEAIRRIDQWWVSTGFGNDMLRISGIKMSLDGGVETGYMREPYAHFDDPQHPRGIQSFPTEALKQVVLAAAQRGWQVGIHNVGDAAIDSFLEAMEFVDRQVSLKGRRFTLIHGMMARPEQLQRVKALDLVVTGQHALNYRLTGGFLRYWGPERAARSIPFRWFLDAGLTVGAGTDSPVGPYDPFLAMWGMVTRQTAAWGARGPEQRVTVAEALRMYTTGSAYVAFEEGVKGSIEPGKLADLVVLSDDLLTVPTDRIKDVKPVKTMLGGRWVYEAPGS